MPGRALKAHREIPFSVALQERVATRDGVSPRRETPAWMGAQPPEKSESIAILRWALSIAALLWIAGGFMGCDEPCCDQDDDCVDAAGCFEGVCALRCQADSMCAEGEECAAAGLCRPLNPGPALHRCAFAFGDR